MNSTNKIDSKQNLNDLPIDIRKQLGFGHKNLNEAMDRKHDSLDKNRKFSSIDQSRSQHEFSLCAWLLIWLSYLTLICTMPFSLIASLKIVQEYERAVVLRLGRILPGGAKGPGLFFILPCVDSCLKVDLRTITFDVPPQEVLTKDSVTITVDAVCYFRTFDPVTSIVNVENAQFSTRLLAATTLRNMLGTRSLQEILMEKDSIALHMQQILDEATDLWGVKVERIEVKDVRLPIQMQRAMATEAEATREAKAKVIAADGEKRSAIALREAGELLSKSPVSLHLRYLQTLTNIAAEKNSTIIFPVPIEFLSKYNNEN